MIDYLNSFYGKKLKRIVFYLGFGIVNYFVFLGVLLNEIIYLFKLRRILLVF